jgi:hypothetical protein
MKIQKIDEEVSYEKIVKELTIEVNGKKVRVYYEASQDIISGDYYNNYDIDESDSMLLTDDELEVLEDNLLDLISNPVGLIINTVE